MIFRRIPFRRQPQRSRPLQRQRSSSSSRGVCSSPSRRKSLGECPWRRRRSGLIWGPSRAGREALRGSFRSCPMPTGSARRNHETATAGCEELATASGRRIPSTCCQVADVPVARDSKPIRRSLKCTPLQVTVGSSRGTPRLASPLVKFPGPKRRCSFLLGANSSATPVCGCYFSGPKQASEASRALELTLPSL